MRYVIAGVALIAIVGFAALAFGAGHGGGGGGGGGGHAGGFSGGGGHFGGGAPSVHFSAPSFGGSRSFTPSFHSYSPPPTTHFSAPAFHYSAPSFTPRTEGGLTLAHPSTGFAPKGGAGTTTHVTPTLTLKGQGGKTQLGTTGPLMFGSQVNGRWTWNSASNGTGRTALRSARNMFLINSHLGVTWQNGKWNPVWSQNGWRRFGRDGDFDRDDFRFHHRFFGGNDFFFNGGFGFGCFDPFMSWPWWWNQPAYYYQPVAVEYPVYEPYPTGTPGYYGPDTGVYEGVPGVTQYGYNQPAANLDQVAAYVQNGDFARAENVLVKMLAKNPSDARLNYVYAYVLGLDQNYNSAAYILRRAITLNGDLLKDPATLMQGILQNDQFSAASARMDQFLIQNPDNVAAHLDRAFFYILSGTPGPASADLNTILGVNRNDQQANFLLQFTQAEGEPVR